MNDEGSLPPSRGRVREEGTAKRFMLQWASMRLRRIPSILTFPLKGERDMR